MRPLDDQIFNLSDKQASNFSLLADKAADTKDNAELALFSCYVHEENNDKGNFTELMEIVGSELAEEL